MAFEAGFRSARDGMDSRKTKPGRLTANGRCFTKFAAALAIALLLYPAYAQDCDARWPQLQFARDDLQRAATEGDLPSAQDYADRARRRFDNLATLATRCECPSAASKFEEATADMRRAQEAESRKDLREAASSARTRFEAAQAQLQSCRKR
jgi:hypothetical protein